MSNLSYAIRGADGVVVRNQLSEATPSAIDIQQANEISLNLTPSEVAGYVQDGNDLVVHLVSGETVTLKRYFAQDDRELFLSKDGELQRVELGEVVNDQYFAQYEQLTLSDKWGEHDQLTFLDLERIEPVVAPLVAPLAGALPGLLGLGGAAVAATALTGGGSDDSADDTGDGSGDDGTGDDGTGDGDDDTVVIPAVDNADVPRLVGGTEDDTIVITGTGEPGSSVSVKIGDKTGDTVIGDDGTFKVVFDGDAVPADGDYDSSVTVVAPDGTTYDLDGPSVDIDTTPPDLAINDGTVSSGDVVNADDQADGHVISGTGEPGASVVVEIDGTTQSTTVGGDGSWSVAFSASEIATGEYTTGVTVTSTDARGNSTTVTDTLEVDTIAPSVAMGTVEGDDIINAAEASDGVELSGTGEPGSSLVISFEGATRTVTVGGDGTWSAGFDASDIGTGTYDSTVTITATDQAGNSQSETFVVHIDTDGSATITTPIAGDDILNASEAASGLSLTGTAEAGSTVSVTVEGVTQTTTADASGTWAVTYAPGDIPSGTYGSTVTVTSTDAAGNTTTTSEPFRVDTEISVALDTNQVGGDNVANATEVSSGFSLTGTAEPNATVAVSMEGVTHTVTASSDGSWAATFTAGEIPAGTYDSTVTVVATDVAGNSSTTTGSVVVDTETAVVMNTGQVGSDDIANASEVANGFALTGSAEPGATVAVSMEGVTHTVTAGSNGAWTATFAGGEIPTGTYDSTVTVTSTDLAGNTATTTGTVAVDTEISAAIDANQVGGDDVANAAEVASGFALTGTAEAGSTVVVQLASSTKTVTAAADGTWTANFTSIDVAPGEYDAPVTVTSVDTAGNMATANSTLRIDTETSIAVDLDKGLFANPVNAAQMQGGVVMEGTTEPGASVSVTVEGVTRTATADASGNWFVTYENGTLPEGTYTTNASLAVTDLAGNTATATASFAVDTEITNPVVQSVTFSDDNVTSLALSTENQDYDIHALNQDGSTSELATTEIALGGDQSLFVLNPSASDGTHLVVASTDDAGNQSDTLLVLDDNVTSATTIDHAATGNFNIEGIELDYASDANLTLNEAQIRALSDTSDTLTIHGGNDDQITVADATKTAQTVDIEGEAYDVYTVGDDGVTLVVDQDINVII